MIEKVKENLKNLMSTRVAESHEKVKQLFMSKLMNQYRKGKHLHEINVELNRVLSKLEFVVTVNAVERTNKVNKENLSKTHIEKPSGSFSSRLKYLFTGNI